MSNHNLSAVSGLQIVDAEGGNAKILYHGKQFWAGPEGQAAAELQRLEVVVVSPIRVTGVAITNAIIEFPMLEGELRGELEDASIINFGTLEKVPPNERMQAAQTFIADQVNRLADREAKLTGKTREEVLDSFRAAEGKRAAQQAASIESLAPSPFYNIDAILTAIGIPSEEDFADMEPGYVPPELRGKKKKKDQGGGEGVAKTPKKKSGGKKADTPQNQQAMVRLDNLSPEEKEALEAAWQEFKSSGGTTWQEFMSGLPEGILSSEISPEARGELDNAVKTFQQKKAPTEIDFLNDLFDGNTDV